MKNKGEIKIRDVITILMIMMVVILLMVIYKYIPKSKTTYTVENGVIENYSEIQGYVIKSEKVLDLKNTNTVIPSVAQDQRVAKYEIVAMYQNNNYDDYKNKINEMDNQIADAIKNLTQDYSNDVASIDEQIETETNKLKGTNSYLKMQEYKNNLNNLAYKKIMAIGNSSPNGSTVKDLIAKRNEYEQSSKKNAQNIKTPTSGIVSYKIDNLENVASSDKILNYTASDFDNIFKQYDNKKDSSFGIKIIDNYNAYLVIKESKGQNDSYIKQGNSYNILLTDSNYELVGNLVKKIESNNIYYCIFDVNNGIENLVDSRIVDLKVTWRKIEGMMVPKGDLIDVNGVSYIKIIRNGDYESIPVIVKAESDNMCIVRNLTDDEQKKYNLKITDELNLYDRVVE